MTIFLGPTDFKKVICFMKDSVTNTYEDQEQTMLTSLCWWKGWANWVASDPDLADISAKVMMHSKATRAQHYLESAEGDLATMDQQIMQKIIFISLF